jgi:hypothetical protein
MLSATYHSPSVRIPTVAGRRASHVPSLVCYGVGLWLGLMLLLLLAPCALAAPLALAWDASAEAAGYIIHYGSASRSYTATVDVGTTTTAALSALDPAKVYYMAVTVILTVTAGGPKYLEIIPDTKQRPHSPVPGNKGKVTQQLLCAALPHLS